MLGLMNCAGLSLVIWLLHSHLTLLQRLERVFSQWTGPAEPQPMPPPGTMFVPGDAEIARRERAMQADSRQRADALGVSRPTGRR